MRNGMKIEQGINDEKQQIAYDSDCQIIFEVFAQLASYKDTTKKVIRKNWHKHLKKREKILLNLKQQKSNSFFSNQNKNYKFENEQLVDKTEYKLIDQNEFDEKFQLLIQKINIVNRELDKKFIDVLKEILIQYSQLVVNKEENSKSITEKIIQNIKNPENQDIFQYLLIWQRLRKITKETRMEKSQKENETNTKTKSLKKQRENLKTLLIIMRKNQLKKIVWIQQNIQLPNQFQHLTKLQKNN
ncbi:unnamed protein product [Paramecium pentaurelia]|uniref:Uncharacterized protein n=1 Tax=Paramecium pentaurelia TaxID=43138 RepID=A0A8S1UPA8_9CILI|nr:unnamed protein product [Paramecium pentaurelia]